LEVSDREGLNLEDLFTFFKVDRNWLPTNLIPIAKDHGGNLICLPTAGKDAGSVYLWDHEKAGERALDDPNDYLNLSLLARSFEDFLAGFRQRKKR
jgi:hypothetical protein